MLILQLHWKAHPNRNGACQMDGDSTLQVCACMCVFVCVHAGGHPNCGSDAFVPLHHISTASNIADLFNWALKADVVTAEQARRCAKRGTGRPWEAVWSQVYSLGVYPDKWPVPLQREGLVLGLFSAKLSYRCSPYFLSVPGTAMVFRVQHLKRSRKNSRDMHAGVDDAQMLAMQNPAGCQPPPGLPVASTSGKRSGSDDGPTVCGY